MKKILCLAIVFAVCLGSTACSSNSHKDEAVANPTKDKIKFLLTAADDSVPNGKRFPSKQKINPMTRFCLRIS